MRTLVFAICIVTTILGVMIAWDEWEIWNYFERVAAVFTLCTTWTAGVLASGLFDINQQSHLQGENHG